MTQLYSTERVICPADTDNTAGRIVWAPIKSIWFFAHALGGIAALTMFPSLSGLGAFLILSAITLCAGHSVGLHRLLIHKSFSAPRPVRLCLIGLGVLVGMAGPFGMILAHDMRDWHQRQTKCPPHPPHGARFWKDMWWQLHCDFRMTHPPRFHLEPEIKNDPALRAMERWWMALQLPLALVLYGLGGFGLVLWGISLRITVSLFGHAAVGHFAHRSGQQTWRIDGLPVQGYNLPRLSLITFGESLHSNHHAFPHSARLALAPGEADPGFLLVTTLERIGLVHDVQLPKSPPARAGLTAVANTQNL